MDSSDDYEEKEFSFNGICYSKAVPICIVASTIHRAVLEGNLNNVKRWVVSGESVNTQEICWKFSPLHLAVICNNLEIIDYLLAREGVEINSRCFEGRTPLHVATSLCHIESVRRLVQAGCDINIADSDNDTALHMSVFYPDICRLLLQHGAEIRTNDSQDRTLHVAVEKRCLEIVHMLLYYNVDANVLNNFGCTPFMLALFFDYVAAQEVLFDYECDFNRFSYDPMWHGVTFSIALRNNSPFVKRMIERGADVNYGDDPKVKENFSAFHACLFNPVDLSTFKMVWERLRYNKDKNTIDLLKFLNYVGQVPTFLQVIIESDNFETAVQFLSKGENYFLFVNKFAMKKFDCDQLTSLTCRLLEYGFQASSYDVHAIFSNYGYCELFRILLYMDNDFTCGWLPHTILTRLIFDVSYDLESIVDEVNDIPKATVLQLLEYSISFRLIHALIVRYNDDESMCAVLGSLPKVPLLMELAHNAARKHIWQLRKITNTCQFYTTIDHLNITAICKNILTFGRKLYEVN